MNEATSASVALKLNRVGITRVRPLEGGFNTWLEHGFPVEERENAA
jgi:3-mercaptopyruvate sulfurtransferase SseA